MAETPAGKGLIHLYGSDLSVLPALEAFPRYGSCVGFNPDPQDFVSGRSLTSERSWDGGRPLGSAFVREGARNEIPTRSRAQPIDKVGFTEGNGRRFLGLPGAFGTRFSAILRDL
jgi:hypothetical protein